MHLPRGLLMTCWLGAENQTIPDRPVRDFFGVNLLPTYLPGRLIISL